MAEGDQSDKPGTPGKTAPKATPESPTTARELDFDDDPHDGGAATTTTIAAAAPEGEEPAPPKPPRLANPQQEAENTLKEAFPTIDAAVVTAVLIASGGKIEPAFNALLGMSDPGAQREPTPPPQPARPRQPPLPAQGPTTTPKNQLEADELYARQLAEHYGGGQMRSSVRGGPPMPRPRQQTGLKPSELYDDNHSFLDDDLPVIKENIRKGFLETQTKVNRWVADLKKKIDGDDDDETFHSRPAGPAQGYAPTGQPSGNRRSGDLGRRSADRDRYDNDPRVLDDDFTGLDLRDDEAPRRSTRPLANPDLFKPTPAVPSSGRKVSFQEGPPEDIDTALRTGSPKPASALRQPSPGGGGGAKNSKWEPLSTVDPTPVADHDPFSLGDSEDEREAKATDLNPEDTARLKKAAAEAMAEDIGSGSAKKSIEGAELKGTKDKVADDKLAGK